MRAKCLIDIEFPDERAVEAAMKAVSHEGNVGSRSHMALGRKGKRLLLNIEAGDVVAMRAAANACMRAIQVFESAEQEEQ
jgi:tRNA threonylcarbamoyladenosine modification (KEOPS) complex  Pcc1 subunit